MRKSQHSLHRLCAPLINVLCAEEKGPFSSCYTGFCVPRSCKNHWHACYLCTEREKDAYLTDLLSLPSHTKMRCKPKDVAPLSHTWWQQEWISPSFVHFFYHFYFWMSVQIIPKDLLKSSNDGVHQKTIKAQLEDVAIFTLVLQSEQWKQTGPLWGCRLRLCWCLAALQGVHPAGFTVCPTLVVCSKSSVLLTVVTCPASTFHLLIRY